MGTGFHGRWHVVLVSLPITSPGSGIPLPALTPIAALSQESPQIGKPVRKSGRRAVRSSEGAVFDPRPALRASDRDGWAKDIIRTSVTGTCAVRTDPSAPVPSNGISGAQVRML